MAFTFSTSGAAKYKAGVNANSTITADATALDYWSDEIENIICDTARVDLITNFGSLTANGKEILQAISSAYIANQIINYDMSGYTSRAEAQTMLDVNDNSVTKGLRMMDEDKIKTYLAAT